jgi:hypothetical protein
MSSFIRYDLLVESRRANAELLALAPAIRTGPLNSEMLGESTYGAMTRQRLFSAPLVSSVHLRAGEPQPWALNTALTPALNPHQASARPFLMSYGGSNEGYPEASRLRSLLVKQCLQLGNTTCRLVSNYRMDTVLVDALRSKRESVFCLEPPGFGDHRKSQVLG